MIGDIKQFNISAGGVVLVVNAIDLGGGQVKFDIISQAGSAPADINAIYWGDSSETGSSQFNLGGPLNMNGSPIDFDGGVVISQPGSSGGTNVLAKPAYLTAGESYQVTYTGAADFFGTIDNLGVRATSTGFDGAGSIKGTDGVPTVIEAPKISINDQCVYEEDGTATFTVSLDHAYPYDITMNYASANGTAGATDFDAINGSFTILAGQTTYQLPVTILDDSNPEATEGFTINLSNASADIPGTDIALAIYDAVGDGTIKDTDVELPPPPPPAPEQFGDNGHALSWATFYWDTVTGANGDINGKPLVDPNNGGPDNTPDGALTIKVEFPNGASGDLDDYYQQILDYLTSTDANVAALGAPDGVMIHAGEGQTFRFFGVDGNEDEDVFVDYVPLPTDPVLGNELDKVVAFSSMGIDLNPADPVAPIPAEAPHPFDDGMLK